MSNHKLFLLAASIFSISISVQAMERQDREDKNAEEQDKRLMRPPAPLALSKRTREYTATQEEIEDKDDEDGEQTQVSYPEETQSIRADELQDLTESSLTLQSLVAAQEVYARGMDTRHLKRLKVENDAIHGARERDCSICNATMIADEPKLLAFLPCGHFFHYDCLKRWLDLSQTCPACRRVSTNSLIHQIMPVQNETIEALESRAKKRVRKELKRLINTILLRLDTEASREGENDTSGHPKGVMRNFFFIQKLQNSLNIMLDEKQVPEGASLDYAIKCFFDLSEQCQQEIETAGYAHLLNSL
jgi:hypothetical protein